MAIRCRHGLMLVLSSPSGAGKSSLVRRLIERDPELLLSVSATTRPRKPGEIDGREYYFLSREEFSERVASGLMLEYADVFGNRYGTPKGPVEEALEKGLDVAFDVDWQGCEQLVQSELGNRVVSVFVLPPSVVELENRLIERGRDSREDLEGRMAGAIDEIERCRSYDYVVVNDDFQRCVDAIETIIAAERMRRWRQSGLEEQIELLADEFRKRLDGSNRTPT